MFGGDNSSSPLFPALVEENQFQYAPNAFPQLQLFGDCDYTVGCTVGQMNHIANKHIPSTDQPNHRRRETDSILVPQKHLISINNYLCQDKTNQSGSIFNPNPVSTGLKLSYEEEEHNSSVTSASENFKAVLPVISSVSDNLKVEIDQQKEEFDQFIKAQEEKIFKGVMEMRQRQTVSFLNAVEKGVTRKLHEKETEIENMNRKNKELMDRIKQITMEVQTWHYKAKYNESVINFLKSNLQQVIAQGAMHVKEGCGDSEVDDAASYTNMNHLGALNVSGSGVPNKPINCRACKVREVSILLLPCRHLCMCKDCEALIDVCPVCNVVKTASVQVYMS
ncbi:BOI-related E3 ubiquitin-protein ligase 1-like isoform X2 [Humulus lupulus]|uniref:BOI-related E3 ubiquitin-protein ligase 1-like isoform X2 n=1 Tax=Humulus lupulus TaxID=3486 RepID=UPI002B409179|nr:BOI-related E3 ubiquitin-protein ligase 1-like isoform X2 [Humulus lupulus]